MTSRTAAARYARALLDVAVKESVDLDQIAKELDEFGDLLKQQPALERVLLNPAVPAPRKKAAVAEITKLAGPSAIVSKAARVAGRARSPGVAARADQRVPRHADAAAERRPRGNHERRAAGRRASRCYSRSASRPSPASA